MATRVHPLARSAFSKSGSSGLYDRARPSYPSQSLALIASRLPASARVVELGSGTGIFTRAFLSSHGSSIGKWLAVEPAEGMREGFVTAYEKSELAGKVDCECVDGEFGKIPVNDKWADLVVIAQAFHWIGKDGSSAMAEIARVLKPGAQLALIWNLEDRDGPEKWVGKMRDAYEAHEVGTPQYRLGWWKHVFDLPEYKENFKPLKSNAAGEALPDVQHRKLETNKDGVVDRVLSKSYITDLTEEKREEVRKRVLEIVEEGDGLVWIDKEQGIFEYPYATDTWIFDRV
ncbi:S-adenosyl-L-methionine-dependent methyltransferase [Atractiella rhizophila]|nr:S-adenosyl-L-methionine-dependent methyltransferase [Atractiella rhizophila]